VLQYGHFEGAIIHYELAWIFFTTEAQRHGAVDGYILTLHVSAPPRSIKNALDIGYRGTLALADSL